LLLLLLLLHHHWIHLSISAIATTLIEVSHHLSVIHIRLLLHTVSLATNHIAICHELLVETNLTSWHAPLHHSCVELIVTCHKLIVVLG
jgi:hypothetical protein